MLVVKKFKKQLDEYDEKIKVLENENNDLKQQKEKMETVQKEMFDKFKSYNNEMTEMRSIYDVIKKNIQDDAFTKVNEANLKVAKFQEQNEDLKKKLMN